MDYKSADKSSPEFTAEMSTSVPERTCVSIGTHLFRVGDIIRPWSRVLEIRINRPVQLMTKKRDPYVSIKIRLESGQVEGICIECHGDQSVNSLLLEVSALWSDSMQKS
jgi:hypothetical protein